jgi:hypothetical protein
MAEFNSKTGRITLTKAHVATDQGARLVDLLLEIGIDGELTDSELLRLSDWLKSAPSEIPAIRHLREILDDALQDGVLSKDEKALLHKQIERTLPSTERERLAIARKNLAALAKERDDAAKEAAAEEKLKAKEKEAAARALERIKWEEERNRPTEPQLNYIRRLGGKLKEKGTRLDASLLIEELLKTNRTITPRQWMILRFWDKTPDANWGKPEVSQWMDDFYSEDEDHQLAWELFKEENGETGISKDPELVPLGCGSEYLQKIKDKRTSGENGPNFLGFFILGLIGLGIWIFLQSIIK